jgi:hypothetical protein
MRIRSLLLAALLVGELGFSDFEGARGQTPLPARSASSLPSPSALAPYEQRLAAAKSVKVMTSIIGIELGTDLEKAHAKLDKLSDPARPAKEEKEDTGKPEEPERKTLWQLAATDYSAIFVKTDEKGRIMSVTGILRPGKEISFEKIGEVKKAPVQSDDAIAWDVVRPKRPLFRVVATGADRKASSISIFVVKRPSLEHPSGE